MSGITKDAVILAIYRYIQRYGPCTTRAVIEGIDPKFRRYLDRQTAGHHMQELKGHGKIRNLHPIGYQALWEAIPEDEQI